MVSFHSILFLYILIQACLTLEEFEPFPADNLTPYKEHHTRKRRSHRFVRDCQPVYYGNLTHEEFPSSRENSSPYITTKHFIKGVKSIDGDTKYASGHITWLANPLKTFSVLEPKAPGKGCITQWFGARETVLESAKQRNCTVAINAGYFNTHTGACLGNIFSDRRFVQDSKGIQNANFGIKSDGTIIVGYLPEEMVHDPKNPFVQLVTGVFWILRNGSVFINESKKVECSETEETGTLDLFASVLSGRTALGHDKNGRVMFVQVDGKTHHRGLNLYDFATLLQEYGLVNAINLDGGGSTTYVIDGLTVNYPSDECGQFNCARKVSTIACAHEPDCDWNCRDRGQCIMGQCKCDETWTGESCDQLVCLTKNCSGHGNCTQVGCDCLPGWYGAMCDKVCPEGMFGKKCQNECKCLNGAKCSKTDGHCVCSPGWRGAFCEQVCPLGSFGEGCQHLCDCPKSCQCHASTGSCANSSTPFIQNITRHWLECNDHKNEEQTIQQPITNYKEKNNILSMDYSVLFVWFIAAVSVCAVSLIGNLVLLYLQCNVSSKRRALPRYREAKDVAQGLLDSDTNEEL